MITGILCALLYLVGQDYGPRRLLTPPQVQEQIIQAFLESDRRALAAFEKLRKRHEANLHADPDVRKQQLVWIEYYKAIEDEYRRNIERLERGELVPPARSLPMGPAERLPPRPVVPRPPIRD